MSQQVPPLKEPVFNQITDLLDDSCYKKRVQESTEIYKYITDLPPTPVCYMKGQAFQGAPVKQVPGALSDVEFYMQTAPLKADLLHYCVDGNPRNMTPEMPEILQNRLLIPDCQDIMKPSYNKVRRSDFNGIANNRRNEIQTERARPMWNVNRGIDTRQAMKDAFRKREQAKLGLKNENATLTPMPEVRCTVGSDDLKCLHVFENGAQPSDTTTVRRFHPGKDLGYYENKAAPQAPTVGAQTIAVANAMQGGKTLRQYAEEQAIAQGCTTKFYNWQSPCFPGQ